MENTTTTQSNGECPACRGIGWMRVQTEEFIGMRRCECINLRVKEAKLAEIPERFRACTFASYQPKTPQQMKTRALMMNHPEGCYFIHGDYGAGKTHLLYSQYRMVTLQGLPCHIRSTAELLEEIQREELERDYISPVMEGARRQRQYHLFWDDAEKFKATDFKYQGLFYLIDLVYRRQLSLSVTSNLSLLELDRQEKLQPAVVRRLDDICQVLEV